MVGAWCKARSVNKRVLLLYSLKFSRIKYFTVLPNSAQKRTFTDKNFVVIVPVMHYIFYELEISREKNFVAILQPAKSAKFFYLEDFRLYGIVIVHNFSD